MMKSINKFLSLTPLVILILLAMSFNSCKKGSSFLNKEHGIIISGVSNCNLVIKSDDNKTFEAINYESNSFTVGDKVQFTYKEMEGGSVCMMGAIIEIKKISKE